MWKVLPPDETQLAQGSLRDMLGSGQGGSATGASGEGSSPGDLRASCLQSTSGGAGPSCPPASPAPGPCCSQASAS